MIILIVVITLIPHLSVILDPDFKSQNRSVRKIVFSLNTSPYCFGERF